MCFSEIMKKFRVARQEETIKKMNALYSRYMTPEEIRAKAVAAVALEEVNENSKRAREEREALEAARAALNPVEDVVTFDHIETSPLSFKPLEEKPRRTSRTNYSKVCTRAPHLSKRKISKGLKDAMFKYLMVDRGRAKATAESMCGMLNTTNYYLEKYGYSIDNIEGAKTIDDVVGIKAFLETIEEFQREQKVYKGKLMKSLDCFTDVTICEH